MLLRRRVVALVVSRLLTAVFFYQAYDAPHMGTLEGAVSFEGGMPKTLTKVPQTR